MKNLRLTKKQFKKIEEGEQIVILIGGFEGYCVKDEYGDFHTPSGVRFAINFYAPTYYDLTINGEDQSPEEDNE